MNTVLSDRPTLSRSPLFGQDPFRALQQELNRLLGHYEVELNGNGLAKTAVPLFDLSESDDAYLVRMDMPGIKADDIDIEISGNSLRVIGKRQEEKEEEQKTFHRVERSYRSFARVITLPGTIDEEKIDAECHDGVLKISLPKSEAQKSKHIKVKS